MTQHHLGEPGGTPNSRLSISSASGSSNLHHSLTPGSQSNQHGLVSTATNSNSSAKGSSLLMTSGGSLISNQHPFQRLDTSSLLAAQQVRYRVETLWRLIITSICSIVCLFVDPTQCVQTTRGKQFATLTNHQSVTFNPPATASSATNVNVAPFRFDDDGPASSFIRSPSVDGNQLDESGCCCWLRLRIAHCNCRRYRSFGCCEHCRSSTQSQKVIYNLFIFLKFSVLHFCFTF